MPLDDSTGQFLKTRQSTELTPAQRLDLAQKPPTQEADHGAEPFDFAPVEIAKDIGRGILEIPAQVTGGIADAVEEISTSVKSLFTSLGAPALAPLFDPQMGVASFIPSTKEAASVTGGLIRGVAQFLTGFLPASKAVGVATKGAPFITSMVAGAVADAAVFDPHEDRLSNLIEAQPELQNPVSEFLAAQPDDTEAEGRFKNAIEGLGLGVLSDGLFFAAKGIRANRARKLAQGAADAEQEAIERLAATGEAPKVEGEAKIEPDAEFKPFDETDEPVFKVGSKKAGEERALNINTAKLETADDVKELIERVGEKFSKDINEARREVITNEETEKLAADLGMTVDTLLKRRKGEAFNAEQALAARKILVASGENLVELAKAASAGADVDLIKFRKAMANHHAIQLQVSGATAEAGRALQSFRIAAKSEEAQARAIKEALEAGGGVKTSRDLADKLLQLEHPHQINTFIKQSAGAKTKDIVFEAWINGLLSSPATHMVNVLGNSITAAWSVAERKVASLIGAGLDVQSIPEGEATASLFGMVQGAKDGMRLSWKALKTGEPADVVTKIETQGHKALTGENLGLSGTAGRFADFMGETVRIPGRLLTASDEFFKSVGYRMELHSQAFRQASGEGLQGDDLAKRITEIVENPPENLHLASVDAARYQTFTKPLEEGGKALQDLVKKIPGARVIVPFVRTPVNIMKYAGERTILAPLAKNVRAEVAAGGARRDLALAKIATGSMVMAASADYTLSGQLTGGGPQNPAMRNLLRTTGWQPYSIKVGDTYYSYSRLDPIGALIGMSADIAEIVGQTTEADALDVTTAAVVATAQNVTSKTYMRGVSEFFDVMSSVSPDPDKRNKRAQRWVERLAGSAVPAGVAQAERLMSPGLEATQGILEKLRSRIPGYSEGLPPRRNIFGEPIVLSGGLGPDIMSPIYTSTDKKDPIADEIVKQQTLLRMPRNMIGRVELDTRQYDKYIRFYAGENNRFVKMPLKTKLRELFSTSMYQNATAGQEGGKSTLIKAVFEAYRNAAQGAMMEEDPRLFMEIQDIKRNKAIKLGAQ
jgi:DNA uptake protein ComE-like DNA-binding protein